MAQSNNLTVDDNFFEILENCTIKKTRYGEYKIIYNKKQTQLTVEFNNCRLNWIVTKNNRSTIPCIKCDFDHKFNTRLINIVNKKLHENVPKVTADKSSDLPKVTADKSSDLPKITADKSSDLPNNYPLVAVAINEKIYAKLDKFLKEVKYNGDKINLVHAIVDNCTAILHIGKNGKKNIMGFYITKLGILDPSSFNEELNTDETEDLNMIIEI
jgi:hypothetical protein